MRSVLEAAIALQLLVSWYAVCAVHLPTSCTRRTKSLFELTVDRGGEWTTTMAQVAKANDQTADTTLTVVQEASQAPADGKADGTTTTTTADAIAQIQTQGDPTVIKSVASEQTVVAPCS